MIAVRQKIFVIQLWVLSQFFQHMEERVFFPFRVNQRLGIKRRFLTRKLDKSLEIVIGTALYLIIYLILSVICFETSTSLKTIWENDNYLVLNNFLIFHNFVLKSRLLQRLNCRLQLEKGYHVKQYNYQWPKLSSKIYYLVDY